MYNRWESKIGFLKILKISFQIEALEVDTLLDWEFKFIAFNPMYGFHNPCWHSFNDHWNEHS